MAAEQNPAIELLISKIEELERKANAYRASVNVLLEKDGHPPMFPDDNGPGPRDAPIGQGRTGQSSSTPSQIKPDSFYGKPQQTAVRELLAIRKATGAGPAKPTEILDGLRVGGYQVEAKSDDIALVGLRAMLRKRTNIFHKLPNGTWGLREWYPNARPTKEHDKGGAAPKDANSTHDPDIEEEEANSGHDAPKASSASAA